MTVDTSMEWKVKNSRTWEMKEVQEEEEKDPESRVSSDLRRRGEFRVAGKGTLDLMSSAF